MALVEMVMPKMGESVMEGTIIGWLKEVGDKIEQDESVLEVATDKVDTEVPASQGGVLKEILAKKGEVVQVGKPIAIIETENGVEEAPVSKLDKSFSVENEVDKDYAFEPVALEPEKSNGYKKEHTNGSSRFYSPLVLSIAKTENISTAELDAIPGTGKENRVTKKDILNYVSNKGSETAPVSKPATSLNGNYEIVEMDRMRKMIAQRMVDSKRISPHVTSFVEADVSTIVQWRNKWKNQIMEREQVALTYTPIFIEAVIKSIKDYPMVNISVDGDKIIVKKDINIGVAVALPNNNLIVPVIKNADRLNILGLTKQVNDLAKRARANKLTADDLSDGTYTVSNVGSFGNVMGTPIILQPQAAILALGTVQKKPAVIETPQGDTLGIRHMMFLSHSYDHRVIDGALGGMFVRRVADYLEGFDINRTPF